MTEREALMRAVCENPDDDTPRLIFADWLDEHGESERAEFIRVQIEAEKACYGGEVRTKLEQRAGQLLERHEQRWREEYPDGPYHWGTFIRGFVHHLATWDGVPLLRQPDDVFNATPLQYLDVEGEIDLLRLLSCRYLARLTRLVLYDARLKEGDLESFAEGEWEFHPHKLILSREGISHDLHDEIVARFPWVSFGRWD